MARLVAYQGAPGAFAEQACRAFLPGWEPVARPSFLAVADAVALAETERGMLPLRNSQAGDVPGVAELIREAGLALVASHDLPVRIHLAALPGASLATIRRVTSHPMAIAQCRAWLDAVGLEVEEAANTALAAQSIAKSHDRTTAALASEAAAALYGLEILARDVQDRADHATTFGIVARADEGNG